MLVIYSYLVKLLSLCNIWSEQLETLIPTVHEIKHKWYHILKWKIHNLKQFRIGRQFTIRSMKRERWPACECGLTIIHICMVDIAAKIYLHRIFGKQYTASFNLVKNSSFKIILLTITNVSCGINIPYAWKSTLQKKNEANYLVGSYKYPRKFTYQYAITQTNDIRGKKCSKWQHACLRFLFSDCYNHCMLLG